MSNTCTTCPFDGSDAVEQAINLGCVPSVYEIMQLKRERDQNWGCHSAEDGEQRICAGYVRACRETGMNYREGQLLTYHQWYHEGP